MNLTSNSRQHRATSRLIIFSLLASLLVVVTGVTTAPRASALAATTCGTPSAGFTGGNFKITPLHGKAFYLDLKKSINAAYVGYEIQNLTGSTKNDLWLELTDFRSTGTQVIGLANPADSLQPIGTLANNATKVVYVLLKSNSYSADDQTHDVRVHSGYPNGTTLIAGATAGAGGAQCFYTFSKGVKTQSVVKTLAASANKVNSITVNTTSPVLGSTVVVTVKGQTGQTGSGSVTPDGSIMWLSAASNSSWPTRALRLESVTTDIKYKKTGGTTDTFADDLLFTIPTTGSKKFTSSTTYTATYTFRVLGGLSTNPTVKPVAQIASGTQIKHTGSYPSTQTTINLAGVTSSMTSSKSVVSIGALETVTGVVYRAVNYRITETDTALQTTIDKIIDDPAAGVIFKPGSAKIRDSLRTNVAGTTIADPVEETTTATDRQYTFGGPFKGYASGSSYVIELTYTMLIPTNTTAAYTNIGYGMVGNTIVGLNSSSVGAAGVSVDGTSSAAIDPSETSTALPKQPQVIDFPALPTLGVGSTAILDAVSESGLPVTYTSTTPDVCTVTDGVLLILTTGTCSITASQAGNDFWDPATNVPRSTSALPGQVITFAPNETMTVGGSQVKAATSDSGLPVTLTVLTPDVCSVDAGTTPFTINAITAGACVIEASQSGGTSGGITYGSAMDVERTINIGALQAISFDPLINKDVGFTGYTISATSKTPNTAGSNTSLPVTFTSKSLEVCEVTSDTTIASGVSSVTVDGIAGASGVCVITASQDGFNTSGVQSAYAPAVDVTQTFDVGTVPSIVVTTNVSTIASGGEVSATATITVQSSGSLTGTVTLYVDGTRTSSSAISTTSVNVSLSASGTNASNFTNIRASVLAPSDPDGEMVFTATFTQSGGSFSSTATRAPVLVAVTPQEAPVATTNDVLESAVGVDTATITGAYIPKGTGTANAVIYLGATSGALTDSTTAVASSGSSASGSSSTTLTTLASSLTTATKYFYKTSVVRDGYEAEGVEKSFTTKPIAPTVGSATGGSTSASVAFTAITPGSGVTIAYRVVCTSSDGGATGSATGSSSPILVSGLTAGGKNYTCKVAATTTTVGSGGGGYGTESTATSGFTTTSAKTSRTIEIKASTNGGVDSATSVNITYGETATLVVIDVNNEGTKSATKASGSACSISGLTVTSVGVGTCTFDGAVSEGATYAEAATTSPASVVVVQKVLTITASSHSVTEGDAVPSISGTYSAFAFSENASNLSGTLSCTTGYTTSSAAGTYATTCTGKTSSNYAITFVAGTITVSSATVTTYTITYDLNGGSGTTPTETAKSNGQTFTTPTDSGFSRSGYTFGGWSCNSVTTGVNVVVTVGTSNITCVAQWTLNSPGNNNSNSNAPIKNVKKAEVSLVTIATTPVKAKSVETKEATPGISQTNPNAGSDSGSGQNTSTGENTTKVLNEKTVELSETTVLPTTDTRDISFTSNKIDKISVVNNEVSIQARSNFSGKTTITITINNSDDEITEITATVVVLPLQVTAQELKALATGGTRVAWDRSPNASGYQVIYKGEVICETRLNRCVINKEIPENEKVQIKSLGKDDTESLPVDATYKVEEVVVTPPAPTKPATTPDAEIKPEDVPAPIVTVEGIGVIPVVVQENSNQTGLDLIGQDWTIAIDSTKKLVQGTTEDSSSRVVIEKGNTVTTNGTGFKPNTQVDVWVYSTATWLGAVMTDEFGNFVTTLPMPTALPEGEHTFQAKGQTPEGLIRSASVPITLVPAVANLGSLKFSVFYPMDSIALSANEKKTIRTKVKAALKAKPKNAKFIVEIVGWVQPTRVSPRIKYLSDGRANAVRKYIQSLGLKGEFVLNAPGHDKVNISASRRADVVISWSAVQPV